MAITWERIWEQNTAKRPRIGRTRRDRSDVRTHLSGAYATIRGRFHNLRIAHNPEVAGSNPVPATKESGSDQAKRPSALAGGRFVL